MNKIFTVLLSGILTLASFGPALAQTQQIDVYLNRVANDFLDNTSQFYVGDVLALTMDSNYVTSVSAQIKSLDGSKTLSPVWAPTATDDSGNWFGYLLPFTDSQVGTWNLTVTSSANTITKSFTVSKTLSTKSFNLSTSSQFQEVGGLTGKIVIQNAEPNKMVDMQYVFIPRNLKKPIHGGNIFSFGATDSQGRLEQFLPSSVNTWKESESGYWIIKITIGEATKQVAFEVTSKTYSDPTTHPAGTNVKDASGTIYFITKDNTRSPYTSAGAFQSYKFNTWDTVVPASDGDLALPLTKYLPSNGNQLVTYFIPPRQGSLINDKGTVYIITSNVRQGFSSEQVFRELGYSFSNVYPGDTSFMQAIAPLNSSAVPHPDGTLVNDKGTLYWIGGYRTGVPSMAILDSWGFWPSDAVLINHYDLQLPAGGTAKFRPASQLDLEFSE